MKRPFAAIGFIGFFVLLVLFILQSTKAAYCVFSAFAALGMLSMLNKNLRQAITVPVCLFAGAAACLLFISADADIKTAHSLAGDNVRVEAVVSERPYIKEDNGRHYCILSINTVGGNKASGKLRLSFSPSKDGINEDLLEIGSKVTFTGKVYVPGESEKSISRYFTGENIVLGAYSATDFTAEETRYKGAEYIFSQIRHKVSQRLRYGLGDKTAGLIIGLLTGDKSFLDAKLSNSFKKTGIAHLMAVSGLHISLWVFSLGSLIPENSKNSRLKYIFLACAVIFIMLLAGMSESVKRAGFMTLVYLSGKLLKRKSDSLNSLGFATAVMVLYNPSCVLSISMQLSFLSTLGILTLGQRFIRLSAELFGSRKINTPVKKLLRSASDVFFISISVLVFTFPVLIYAFGGISGVSAWVNALVSFAVMPLLLLSGVYAVLSQVSFVAYPLALAVSAFAEYITAVARLFSGFRHAFLVFEPESLLLCLSGAVIIVFLCAVAFSKSARSLTALVLCITLCSVFLVADRNMNGERVKIHIDFYGDCTAAAVEKDKRAVLLNNVPKYQKGIFISSLDEKGVTLYGEAENYGMNFLKSAHNGKYIAVGKQLTLFDGVTLNGSYNQQIISACGKDIHIFYAEALQCGCGCDIIIKINDKDVVISVGENSFYMAEEKAVTLTLYENKTVLRGKNQWLNLMKNS